MSINHSPKTVTDGLVFYYDMHNTKKSWKGAPTTNIIPSPEINGRFNVGNGWGTYNVILYNNAQYFSIGTISSVSSNIVTTSTAHPFTTYDVVRPQTTGGGVTAGVDYFIKVINSTQFTIHTYNGSQDGSQGYINPSTGTHKVYDSVALDQRVTINSTNFPTMWWGAPHLPNRCHVKEIVPNGGYEYGTNCMRIHVTRTTAVDGGMAYGVNTPVTLGDIITVSFWTRTNSIGNGISQTYSTHFGSGYSAPGWEFVPTTEWKKVTFQWTSSNTYNFLQYFYIRVGSAPYYVDIADLQVEVNRGFASPFTTSSRSNTQCLYDLVSNNTITANSLTYNSDNTFEFNGTNNGMTVAGTNFSLVTQTISCWCYSTNFNHNGFLFEKTTNNAVNTQYSLFFSNPNILYYRTYGLSTTDLSISTDLSGVMNNSWNNIVATFDGTYKKIYINGILVSTSGALTGTLVQNNTGNVYIGVYGSFAGFPFNGKISSVKIYNRSLTPEEVKQNFNASKSKFGL